jgi:2-haloacid dehalogenase
VARPNEHGPGRGEPVPKVPVDVAAADLADLAAKLAA